jgi:cytochrome c oxidase subunit 2
VTDTRSEYDSLAGIYLPIAIAVVVLVLGTMAFALFRYQRREGRQPSTVASLPVVEGVYALLLVAIVAVLVTVTFRTEAKVDAVSDDPDLTVDVIAFQWGWRFTYPERRVTVVGNVHRPPSLFVPAGSTVRFELRSRDVIHSFWIPELRFKRDAIPGRTTAFDLTFDANSIGRCAEFCGLDHAGMTFDIVALSPPDFASWISQRAESARGG